MAGAYGSGKRSGGAYGGSSTPAKKKRHSAFSGILSAISKNPIVRFEGNLAGDIKDMAFGLPTGLVGLATDPIGSLEMMAKSTWHDWSPLFEGDIGKFGRQFYDHPLAPILDVLSLATLGAGTAVKGAKIISEAGVESSALSRLAAAGRPFERELRSPVMEGKGAVVHTKTYSGNPFIRARQLGQERAVNGLASLLPSMFGVGKKIDQAFIDGAGKTALRGAERADAWRWFMREKFDAASRQHAVQAANNLYISNVVAQAKRLNEDTHAVMQRITPHMTQQLYDHAHKLAPDELGAELAAKKGHLQAEYTFADAGAAERVQQFIDGYQKKRGPWTPEKFHDYLAGKGEFSKSSYASMITTKNVKKAARDERGDFLVVRNHEADPFILEAANSVNFLGNVWKKSTTMWKWAVLAARPAYLVNNAVGNLFMYMVSSGPKGFRGLVDAHRQIRPGWSVRSEMSRAERQLYRTQKDWQDKYYLGLHRGFSRDVQESLGTVRVPIGTKKAKFLRLVGGGLYDITHQISDVFLRRATVNRILRDRPEVQDLMRKGMHFDDAAMSVSESRAIREAVQQQVNDVLGQYHYLNPAERAVRAIVPFYTWDRAIARHGAHLFLDRPTTAALLTQTGYQGVETTEQLLGEIPEFLNSALPLSMLGFQPDDQGRLPILGTTGLNPYASLASIVDTTSALLTGGSDIGPALAGQLHPFITGAVEATTGTSMLTGARMPTDEGGLVPRIMANTFVSLPEFQVAQAGIAGAGGSDETLFAKDMPQYLSAFLGVPVKYLNQQAAEKMAREQKGIRVKRKRRKKRGVYG